MAFALAAAAAVSGTTTAAALAGYSPLGIGPDVVRALLYLDIVIVLALGAVVTRRVVTVWVERRRGLAGSSLLIRMVALFSVVAVTPAIVVAVFSALFLDFGVQAWFSQRVRTALDESRAVGHAYLRENQQNIRADAYGMAFDLNRQAFELMRSPPQFSQAVAFGAAKQGLDEAMVIDRSGHILARGPFSLALEFEKIPAEALDRAMQRTIVTIASSTDERVRAIVFLEPFGDAFLVVGRRVDPKVLESIQRTDSAVAQYQSLEQRQADIRITFVVIYGVVSVLMLLAAVWVGISFATQLVEPIGSVISAADRVAKGDLTARVEATVASDEIGVLSRAFNRMAEQIDNQRRGLVEANRELAERTRFTETVLTGVSAGVIGLDAEGQIRLANRSASDLLGVQLDAEVDRPFAEAIPEMADLFAEAARRSDRPANDEVKVARKARSQTLQATIVAEKLEGQIVGYVVTFDDVTELLSAQRTAAWADVARRIAHEIKNPLTPIQLSAERLKRKYLKEITSDPQTFTACTDTIVRQVEDIGRMVDEFSSFARMPQPSLKPESLAEICRQVAFLERSRSTAIAIDLDLPPADVTLNCDRQQVGRALTNVLKNAAESVTARPKSEDGPLAKGRIRLTLQEADTADGREVRLIVEDNGIGLPREQRDRLTEPYVTSREKGTGLGLAIVKKIMEDHGGQVMLEDREGGGARVSLVFGPTRSAPIADEAVPSLVSHGA
ncbi:MAG: PAS domain-containing sensor histidine kinase [Rhodospirillales bacterium]|nr:PAS domain-containing sensor histidine kinase [Rhodospirillales bacterium]